MQVKEERKRTQCLNIILIPTTLNVFDHETCFSDLSISYHAHFDHNTRVFLGVLLLSWISAAVGATISILLALLLITLLQVGANAVAAVGIAHSTTRPAALAGVAGWLSVAAGHAGRIVAIGGRGVHRVVRVVTVLEARVRVARLWALLVSHAHVAERVCRVGSGGLHRRAGDGLHAVVDGHQRVLRLRLLLVLMLVLVLMVHLLLLDLLLLHLLLLLELQLLLQQMLRKRCVVHGALAEVAEGARSLFAGEARRSPGRSLEEPETRSAARSEGRP